MYKGIEFLTDSNWLTWSTKVFAQGMNKGWAKEVLNTPKPTVPAGASPEAATAKQVEIIAWE